MENFSRRQFLGRTALAVAPALLLPHFSFGLNAEPEYKIIETPFGKLRGFRENGVNIFKGVPYAGNISGEKRFQKAEPVKPWTGTRDALQLGNPSIQPPNQTYGINEPKPAEECLVLNIWTPANDGRKRPVMVYNHGGGFRTGSGGSTAQDGANLARMYDVVVVATNHRLGLSGFLYLDEIAGEEYKGSGNRGVQDIAVALQWINENIELFGGDPANVMIFGESGGGMKTSCLYAMPEAAPFFHKASIESGPGVELMDAENAAETTRLVLDYLNISPQNWRKLLEIPAEKLLEAQEKIPQKLNPNTLGFHGIGNSGIGSFGAVKDGFVLPEHPFDPAAPAFSKSKPLLVGWNEDEYIFFAMSGNDKEAFKLSEEMLKTRLKNEFGDKAELIFKTYKNSNPEMSPTAIYMAIRSIMFMGLGSIRIAERKSLQNGAPVYLYNFGYKSDSKVPGTDYEFGAMHALDIPFKFYNVDSGWPGTRPERYIAAKNMTELWTSFARTGRPAANTQPEWQPYNLKSRPTFRIDVQCELINNRFGAEREMWETILK
ncbi:MAG: carboxylesterase [Bacteroidetes bacterium GWB2_41_8]|nr:MAG: carboxylesterase [Bacteroidetes bacterium GWB2_41_8]